MKIVEAKNPMKAFLAQKPYSTRSQMIMILLGIMIDCKGGHSKKSVISMIEESRWFDLRIEDRKPYPTVQTKEPRWQTLVAFSRKDSTMMCCLFRTAFVIVGQYQSMESTLSQYAKDNLPRVFSIVISVTCGLPS
jgi:hypothetical protein